MILVVNEVEKLNILLKLFLPSPMTHKIVFVDSEEKKSSEHNRDIQKGHTVIPPVLHFLCSFFPLSEVSV